MNPFALAFGLAVLAFLGWSLSWDRDGEWSAPVVSAHALAAASPPPAAFAEEAPAAARDDEERPQAQQAIAVAISGPALRALFHAAVLREGEQPRAIAVAGVEAALAARLPPEQLQAAMAVLQKYLRYSDEAGSLFRALDSATHPQALALHLRELQELRARSFTAAEAGGLFADDFAYEQLLLRRREIAHAVGIDEDERHRRLALLEASVTPQVRAVESLRSGIGSFGEPVIASN